MICRIISQQNAKSFTWLICPTSTAAREGCGDPSKATAASKSLSVASSAMRAAELSNPMDTRVSNDSALALMREVPIENKSKKPRTKKAKKSTPFRA